MLVVVLDSHFSTILFHTQEECTIIIIIIIIIIIVRMEAFYSFMNMYKYISCF